MEPKGKHDIVTDIDSLSEAEIIRIITASFPGHSINAEESGEQDKGSAFTWIIDPIDGTSNFFTDNPYFAVSIALAENNEIIISSGSLPVKDELTISVKL